MISEALSEVKRGSLYKASGSQSAPLPQSGRVNFAPEMILNLYDYRSAGTEQRYFPDETVDEPGPNYAPKMAPVSSRSPVSKRTAPEVSNLNTDNPPENTIALSTISKATDSDPNVYLCVVPVRVRYKERVVLMYAFLDQESTHTFCNKTLIQSLGITGCSEKICLQTLTGSVKGYDGISCELEVSGLDGEVYYTIPNVFSMNKIPVRPNLVLT